MKKALYDLNRIVKKNEINMRTGIIRTKRNKEILQ